MTAPMAPTTASSAVEILEAEIREKVRHRELEAGAGGGSEVSRLVEESVDDYRERYLRGGLPPLDDGDVRRLLDRISGFGALGPFLADPEVEEVWINEPGRVFVARRGYRELTTVVLSPGEVEELVERMLARAGRRLDRSQPFVDARLPDGSRLHVVIPPVTDHWAVNIRKFVGLRAHTLDELVALGSCSPAAARFLGAAVAAGLNIVVAGPVGSGKTTLLNCLASCVPAGERIVTCEEVFELQVAHPDVVSMQCRQPNLEGEGAVTLRDLVRESLRMRPDRIVIGEVRGAEALDMLLAMNTGHEGSLTTIHGSTPRDALDRLATLAMMAEERLGGEALTKMVSRAIELVLQLRFEPRSGRRRLVGVFEVTGLEGSVITGQDLWTLDPERDRLRWTGLQPRCLTKLAAKGVPYALPPVAEAKE